MKKSVVITVMVDDVDLDDLAQILERIEQTVVNYENKRVQVSMQDEHLVAPRFG